MYPNQNRLIHKLAGWLLAGAILFGLMSAVAQAQTAMRVRGAITSFDGHVLVVKVRDGSELKINVPENTSIRSLIELQMGDIKQGNFVGVTAIKRNSDGAQYALEVHIFPEASRGSGEGHRDWDLEPGSTMTNANVDAMVELNNGKELTLGYKGGMQKIIVPPDVPIVSFVPGDKSLLKTGVQIFATVQQTGDGTLTAQRIMTGKDGMKPPM